MSASVGAVAPAFSRSVVSSFTSMALSAEAPPFHPRGVDAPQPDSLSEAEKQFSRCAAKLRSLRADSGQLREELNQLFDQLLSENYNRSCELPITIRPEVTPCPPAAGLLLFWLSCLVWSFPFLFPECLHPTEARQRSSPSKPRTFSCQVLPTSPSPPEPAEGKNQEGAVETVQSTLTTLDQQERAPCISQMMKPLLINSKKVKTKNNPLDWITSFFN